jgi:inorganic pyrophosphatase
MQAGAALHLWHDIPIGDSAPRLVDAVIEIPHSGRVKYELDKELGLLRATRVLYGAVHYPANYGFIPRTYAPDGDALDILVLGQEQLLPGTIVSARVVGVMPMVDTGEDDDKIIAVQIGDPGWESIRSIDELPPYRMNEVMRFFGDYKALEGKEVKVAAPKGVEEAVKIVSDCMVAYKQERTKLMESGGA